MTSSLPSWRMKPFKTEIAYREEFLPDEQILSIMREPPLSGEEKQENGRAAYPGGVPIHLMLQPQIRTSLHLQGKRPCVLV